MNNGQEDLRTAVVISGGNSPAALDIVRSLGHEGISTVVASAQLDDIAQYSRHCARFIPILPFSPGTDKKNLELLMSFAGKQRKRPVLYYASDPELSFIRRNRSALNAVFTFLLPQEFVLECLFNKVLFSWYAAGYRLPVPNTVVIRDVSEIPSKLAPLNFPCIVKPAFSEDWNWETSEQWKRFGPYKKALRRFKSMDELKDFCTALPERQFGFLIQEYIEGRDERILSFHGYFDENSRCLGHFIGRKIRTYPPHTGGSTCIQTYHNPMLAELSIAYLQRIQFRGIVKIDYKWDADAGEYKILEINPRYNLWEVLGMYAGINLVHIAFRHQCGGQVAPKTTFEEDVRLVYVKQDLRSMIEGYAPLGEWSVWQYAASLVRKNHFRVFDLYDPFPFFASLAGFMLRNCIRMVWHNRMKKPAALPKQRTEDADAHQPISVLEEVLNH